MPIRAQCPAGHAMMVPDHRAGTRLRCPRCGLELLVPGTPVNRPEPRTTTAPAFDAVTEPAKERALTATREKQAASEGGKSLATADDVPLSNDEAPTLAAVTKHSAPPQPAVERLVVTSQELADVPAASTPPPTAKVVLAIPDEPAGPPIQSADEIDKPKVTSAPTTQHGISGKSFESQNAMPQGWVPDRERRSTALYLGFVVATLAIFSVTPAAWEWFAIWQNPDALRTPPWVFAMLLAGVIQMAYAVYLIQLPDWSALWTTTIAVLLSAAAWATLLGATLLGKQESTLVLLFRYADKLEGNRAAMWCFVMLCFSSVTAYFLGLTAARWKRAYRLLRNAHSQST